MERRGNGKENPQRKGEEGYKETLKENWKRRVLQKESTEPSRKMQKGEAEEKPVRTDWKRVYEGTKVTGEEYESIQE